MGWQSATLQNKADLLRQIHAIEPHQRFQPENALVDVLPLSFYPPGSLLIRCRDPQWREGGDSLWYARLPGQEVVPLDGSAANIHHLNARAGLHLSESTLPAYLKFRLYFGKEQGRRRTLAEDRPLEIAALGKDFVCACSVLEDRQLYAARFKVSARGELSLLERTPLATQISAKPLKEPSF